MQQQNLKFSPANAKTKALYAVPELQKFLANKRKVYSLDLLSGWTCPAAKDCKSKVIIVNDKRTIQDGTHTKFRCFSASQEAFLPAVYESRSHNTKILRELAKLPRLQMAEVIASQLPKNLGILRWHVAGDFFDQVYFDAAALVARKNPDRLFYAYTKSVNYWRNRLGQLTENFVLTASYGGKHDDLIKQENLRSAVVVYHPDEASQLGLEIDHTDELASNPEKRHENFALLLHGIMHSNSEASKAISRMKKEKVQFSYK